MDRNQKLDGVEVGFKLQFQLGWFVLRRFLNLR